MRWTFHDALVPDILHTNKSGFMLQVLGGVLNTLRIVGKIDPMYKSNLKVIDQRVRSFPRCNSGAINRHVVLHKGISVFLAKDVSSSINKTLGRFTGALNSAGVESFKVPSLIGQLMWAIGDGYKVLPTSMDWYQEHDHPFTAQEATYGRSSSFSVHQIVVHALAAVIELTFYVDAKLMTKSNIKTYQYLTANMRTHVALLHRLRSRLMMVIPTKANGVLGAISHVDEVEGNKRKRDNDPYDIQPKDVKSHLAIHHPHLKMMLGADTSTFDMERSEHAHLRFGKGAYGHIPKQHEHGLHLHDMLEYISREDLLNYNEQRFGLRAMVHHANDEEVPYVAADGMRFTNFSSASKQYLRRIRDQEGGQRRWVMAPVPKNVLEREPFVHPRLGGTRFFEWLALPANSSELPRKRVEYMRLLSQIKACGDGLPHGIAPYILRATPSRLVKCRSRVSGTRLSADEFNFVEVSYRDKTGSMEKEVAMVVAILNYKLRGDSKERLSFVIAWMQDSEKSLSKKCAYPYPLKQFVISKVGKGLATATGNRFLLDIVGSNQIGAPVYLIKQITERNDDSIAFLNDARSTWAKYEAVRYFHVPHDRITASYDLVTDDYNRIHPYVFLSEQEMVLAEKRLALRPPKNAVPRW